VDSTATSTRCSSSRGAFLPLPRDTAGGTYSHRHRLHGGLDAITAVDLMGMVRTMFFGRSVGLFGYFDIDFDATLGPVLAGSDPRIGIRSWDDPDRDGAGEMFFIASQARSATTT
jgi:hypothetical protein